MRIIGRAEFLAMPAGTIYKVWEPSAYHGLLIKGETIGRNDFYETDLLQVLVHVDGEAPDDIWDTPEDGSSFKVEYDQCRNGEFTAEEQYCIFEKADVLQFQQEIGEALRSAY